MSGTSPTVAGPSSTNDYAAQMLATMAALSGVVTDYNVGSVVRTQAESTGSVIEQQGVASAALALQAFTYGALSALGITPILGTYATGVLTFSTGPSGVTPPPAAQDVALPAGTLVQTQAGIIAQTSTDAVIASGSTTASVAAIATAIGTASNVTSGAFNQIISSVGYPMFVRNDAPFQGGAPAETISATLARFTAALAAGGLSSPVAVANAPIGVRYTPTGETVKFAACYEPWLAAGSGAGSGTAGFTVFIDNGSGAASSGLISAVSTKLNGNVALNQSGYRPVGVPYAVQAVTPVYAVVVVSGASQPGYSGSAVSGSIVSAVQSYFNGLQFMTPCDQAQIAAAASNAAPNVLAALSVNLYVSGSGSSVPTITGQAQNRVILGSLTVAINP